MKRHVEAAPMPRLKLEVVMNPDTFEAAPIPLLEGVVAPDPFEIARGLVMPLGDDSPICGIPIMKALALLTGSHTRCGANSPARTLCPELFKAICLLLWHTPAGNYLVQIVFAELPRYHSQKVLMYITINAGGDIVQATTAELSTYWSAGEKPPFGHIDSNTMSLEIKHTIYGGREATTRRMTMPSLHWTTQALLQGSVTHHIHHNRRDEEVQGQASLSFQGKLREPDNAETATEIVARCAKQEALYIELTCLLT
ncbi:hypothetical protein Pelo_16987 [Pelomyxa schiedti]|nr:hypothetical protein Pelo_16987 [Pelomyxa schiedti]